MTTREPAEVTDVDRCAVCDLATQVLGCKLGKCCAPEVPVDKEDLFLAIVDSAERATQAVWNCTALPISSALAGAAMIRAKIKIDGDALEMWLDLIRYDPMTPGGFSAMERLLGMHAKGSS